MMDVNSTCVPGGNSTSECPSPGPSTGLVVGLSVFFLLLLLGVVGGVLAFKQFGKLRRVLSFGSRRRIEKERDVCGEAPKVVKEVHESPSGPEISCTAQGPIYENVARAAVGHKAKAPNRPAPKPEEDVYLQCDAIYNNDPDCNPSAHHQEDDTYIIPDS